jgi:hypothetical protein
MNISNTTDQIKQLKKKIQAAERSEDEQVVKLFALMVLVAVGALLIHGRVNIFQVFR